MARNPQRARHIGFRHGRVISQGPSNPNNFVDMVRSCTTHTWREWFVRDVNLHPNRMTRSLERLEHERRNT